MDRRHFLKRFAKLVPIAGAGVYLISDKRNLTRSDVAPYAGGDGWLQPEEFEILSLAALAPSGHNTQPWFVEYIGPFHWIIGNDKRRWLPAVDPDQRETVLSIGAFVQNLEYAANHFGLRCRFSQIAAAATDERILEVRLERDASVADFDIAKLRSRRTVRARFARDPINETDLNTFFGPEDEYFQYLPPGSAASEFIGEQTVEANRLQANRDAAQLELRDWVRFSSREARIHRDGLTTASMEIGGFSGWFVRNFYTRDNVLSADFRERGIELVKEQVAGSGGWIILKSNGHSVGDLIESGRRMQRLFLQVRERNIGIHPMTQILEEPATRAALNEFSGIGRNVQFILRTGYVDEYPPPVSLRRPVGWFLMN